MKPQSASEQKTSIQDIRRTAKRGPGHPRAGDGKNPPRSKRSWSQKTQAYVKMVTEGKGAPCKIWSMREKRQLLAGLQKHSHQDWDSLCKLIPSRTKKEIQEYIHNLKGGEHCKRKMKDDVHLAWAPIESWLDLSTEMVHYEQMDLSSILSRVFSIIGHFGSFPQTASTSSSLVPDYGKLYRYLAAIMDESLSMPDLSSLESAIIADLMHGMGDLLRMSDTSLQRKVMCWKYKMLNYKFDFDNVRASLDRIRMALTNDFSDLQKEGDRGVSRLPSFTQAASTMVTQAAVSGTSAGQSAVSSDASSFARGAQSSSVPSSPSQPVQTASDNLQPGPGPSTSTDGHQSSPQKKGDENEDQPRRKRGRRRVHDWSRPIEKPRLFTMNPFCVPIRLLRLKSLMTEAPPKEISQSGTGRQRSVSVTSTSSVNSDGLSQISSRKGVSIRSQSNQAQVRNSIRQVTGLYVPQMTRKNKRRNQLPASPKTMTAISAALAKRYLEKKAPTVSEVPPPDPKTVQVTKRKNNSPVPSQAFRCVRLPDGKMALVPIHLSDAATLSQLKMKEALPLPKQMPSLRACPALQNSVGWVHPSAGSSTVKSVCSPVTGSPRSVGPSSSAISVDTPGPVREQTVSAQSTFPQAHYSVSAEDLPPPLSRATLQKKGVLQQVSDPVTGQLVRVSQTSSSLGQQNSAGSSQQTGEIVCLPVSSPQVSVARTSVVMQSKAQDNNLEEGKNVPQSQTAQPVCSWSKKSTNIATNLDCICTPETATRVKSSPQRTDLDQQPRYGNPVQKLAQIIPKKRRRLVKTQLAQPETITTEIVVSLPSSAVKTDSTQTTPSATTKTASPKTRRSKKPKLSHPEPDKCSAPKKKATTRKSQKSKTASPRFSVEPLQCVQKIVAISESRGSLQSQQAVTKKATSPQNTAVSMSAQSASSSEGSGLVRQSENGGSMMPDCDNSPEIHFSHTVKTYSCVPRPAVTEANSGIAESALPESPEPQCDQQKTVQSSDGVENISYFSVSDSVFQTTSSHRNSDPGRSVLQKSTTENCHQTDINSDQKQTHLEASSMDHSTSDRNRKGKSSFKSILAQVASPRTSSAKISPDSVRSSLLNKRMESSGTASPVVYTNSDQIVLSCRTFSSSSQSSYSLPKNPKLMKNFLTTKDPETKPQSPRSRGRKKKTDECPKDGQSISSKTSKAVKVNLSSGGQVKKAGGSRKGGGVTSKTLGTITKKRPSNFLASQDISKMNVEIVTPEDVRRRQLANADRGEYETERQKNMAEVKKNARKLVSLVMDDGEISLVSI